MAVTSLSTNDRTETDTAHGLPVPRVNELKEKTSKSKAQNLIEMMRKKNSKNEEWWSSKETLKSVEAILPERARNAKDDPRFQDNFYYEVISVVAEEYPECSPPNPSQLASKENQEMSEVSEDYQESIDKNQNK